MHLHHDHDAPRDLFTAHIELRRSAAGARKTERIDIAAALACLGSAMRPGDPPRTAPVRSVVRASERIAAARADATREAGE